MKIEAELRRLLAKRPGITVDDDEKDRLRRAIRSGSHVGLMPRSPEEAAAAGGATS